MQGTILSIAGQGGQGLILGDDGARYTYTPMGWRDPTVGAWPGMKVDFETRGAHAVGVYPLPGQAPPSAVTANAAYNPQPHPTISTFPPQQPSTTIPSVPQSPAAPVSSLPPVSNAPAPRSTSKGLIWGALAIAVVGISIMAVFMLMGGTDGVRDLVEGEEVQPTPALRYSDTRDRVRGFDEDEDERGTYSDAADRAREFAEDEDVQDTYSDAIDRVREFAEDEDVQRTFDDTADVVERGLDSIFGD